jgi:hypothetical protein
LQRKRKAIRGREEAQPRDVCMYHQGCLISGLLKIIVNLKFLRNPSSSSNNPHGVPIEA